MRPKTIEKMNGEQHDVSDTYSLTRDNTSISTFISTEQIKKRARLSAIIVLVLSVAGCITFFVYGITRAEQAANDSFNNRATELVRTVETTWKDYENAALSIQNICRRSRNTTRKEFREFYEYLLAEGLGFESAQCSPNITHAERPKYEEEARNFYAEHYPSVNYTGITSFITDNVTGEVNILPSPPRPFYMTVHYLEPVLPNAPAIELDMYSNPPQKREMDIAIQTRKPVLSARLHLVQETEDDAYGVIIYHPGIYLETEPDDYPLDLSLIVVRIPALLSRVALVQEESLAVYLYDTTDLNTNGVPHFLGAGGFYIYDEDDDEYNSDIDDNNEVDGTAQQQQQQQQQESKKQRDLKLIREIELATLQEQNKLKRNPHYYEKEIPITSSGTWVIAVIPVDDAYKPQINYVLFGGSMILAAGIFVSIWYFTSAQREAKINEVRVTAEAERAALIVKNAEKAAQTERELNDFLAHEVRNPLAAAISACSFVSSAVQGDNPLSTEEDRITVRDDVNVMKSSLSYVNDLLRNMIDMHKAESDQIRIQLSPACLRKDIFEPVATILHPREGSNFEVIIDCPEHLVISTDRIRLKQIVLNLANNSCKFVQQGYVKIGAKVDEESKNVHLFVEDSGTGIPEEKRDKLFEKFQSSLDSLSQGTGIGLSLCKDLTELLGGTIVLDENFVSGIDNCPGTRLVINLNTQPLDIDEYQGFLLDSHNTGLNINSSTNGGTVSSLVLPDLPLKFKVLFVDDDLVLRKLFMRSVKRVAPTWTIEEATNGETAIRLVAESLDKYDLIFVDQYMASIQKQLLGTETARELRSIGYKGFICGLSANAMEDAFISSGADAFMFKPFPCEKNTLTKELCRLIFPDLNLPRQV